MTPRDKEQLAVMVFPPGSRTLDLTADAMADALIAIANLISGRPGDPGRTANLERRVEAVLKEAAAGRTGDPLRCTRCSTQVSETLCAWCAPL